MMRFLAALFATLMLAAPAMAAPVKTGHIESELVAQATGVAPGQTLHLAVRQSIQPGWHTYWRNPGDSGQATEIQWTLPAGFNAGEIIWPAPSKEPTGPLMNYGYTGTVLLPVTLTAPADARVGQVATLKAKVMYLVCADLCVPEDADVSLDLPVVAAPAPADPKWAGPIDKALAAAPARAPLSAVFEKQGAALKLAVTGAPLKGADLGGAYFYPYAGTVIDHAKPQAVDHGPDGLTLALAPGYDFQKPTPPAKLDGVLAVGGKAYEVSAAPGPLPAGAAGLGAPAPRSTAPAAGGLGLASAALFALLGGLILNLMPCVFPVLAMKAASLAGHGGGQEAEARRQGLAFGIGCLVTFLALAGVLIGLKAAGSAIGWGFQLQSPPVVAVLALLMLAVALNLSGVFEVGTSLQGVGTGLASQRGLAGAFFTGALAVVVAAPCTAPFMGPALGWALTQTPVAALTVFLALGIGFAAPFVAVAFIPGLLSRLPRPGAWMEVFKKALAFPMYAAAGWLVWVLTLQAGPEALARILAAAVIVALACWLAGFAARRAANGQRAIGLVIAATVLAVLAIGSAVYPRYAQAQPAGAAAVAAADLPTEAYTPDKLAALQAQGKPVFVNYTAAWCVSCQVNDRVALSTAKVADAFKARGVTYMKADWTNRDATIAADLARFGRAGVPLYLVYGADGGAPQILPSILTEGVVLKALDKAAAKGA
jgi:thiol:disulfide interchange protein